MGDIHGAYKALVQCLQRAGFDYSHDVLIQLGDVVDGYDDVFECVEELLKIKKLIAIRGNHDAWFHDFSTTDFHPFYWTYGGKGTLISYLKHTGSKGMIIPTASGFKTSLNASDIPLAHREFFRHQKPFYIDKEQRCFVHGGFNRAIPFLEQAQSAYYWDRDLWNEAMYFAENGTAAEGFEMKTKFNEIYIGHTPTTNWNTEKPMTALNITNLDTGAGHQGRLTVMDINSKQYWQSDPLKELYEENHRS